MPDSDIEQERLAALNGYGVLDTPAEPQFESIVREAAKAFRTPIALISLVDEHRQWLKARVGLDVQETPRTISFCTHAIERDDVMVVVDASKDIRLLHNPLVTGDPSIRFYAGAPLRTGSGMRIGTLCVIDTDPRNGISDAQRTVLRDLASRTVAAFELRKAVNAHRAASL